MDHRGLDALIDSTIDREIRGVLAVEPSPEFVARVRTSVAAASASSRFPSLLPAMGALAAALVLVIVTIVVVSFSSPDVPERVRSSVPSTPPAGAPADNAVVREPERVLAADATTVRISRRPAHAVRAMEPELPEVIVSPDDIKAFHDVVSSVSGSRFAISSDAKVSSADQQAFVDITVPEIVIAPVELLTGHEGVLQ
jgi:hypothetical protein